MGEAQFTAVDRLLSCLASVRFRGDIEPQRRIIERRRLDVLNVQAITLVGLLIGQGVAGAYIGMGAREKIQLIRHRHSTNKTKAPRAWELAGDIPRLAITLELFQRQLIGPSHQHSPAGAAQAILVELDTLDHRAHGGLLDVVDGAVDPRFIGLGQQPCAQRRQCQSDGQRYQCRGVKSGTGPGHQLCFPVLTAERWALILRAALWALHRSAEATSLGRCNGADVPQTFAPIHLSGNGCLMRVGKRSICG